MGAQNRIEAPNSFKTVCKISPGVSYGLLNGKTPILHMHHHNPLIIFALVLTIACLVYAISSDSNKPAAK